MASGPLQPSARTSDEPMRISFIVLAWNSARFLRQCVSSISDCLSGTGFDYEILVLDNGSTDGGVELLHALQAADPGHIKAQFSDSNLGTTVSRNRLLRVATGDMICVLDSDVELRPGTIERLVRTLEANPRAGMVVPTICYPSGNWQKSIDAFPTVASKLMRFLFLKSMERRNAHGGGGTTLQWADCAISAFWLLRRDLLDRVGMLDENIFYSPEDVDYCLRVWKCGYGVLYDPTVTVVHHAQEISRGFKLNRAKFEHIAGLFYFFRKHRYFLRRPRFPGFTSDAICAE
jgi:GT2 family glycosyltransferase